MRNMKLLIFLYIFYLSIHAYGAVPDCLEEFSLNFEFSTEISFTNYTGYCILYVSFSETVPVGSNLYSISWSHELEKPPYLANSTNINTTLEYIDYNIRNTDKIMSFSVVNSMKTLMDYGNSERQTTLYLEIFFAFSKTDIMYFYIVHNLVDVNTATPTFERSSYSFSIIETFPTDLTIPGFLIRAWDYDAMLPNNQFEVKTDDTCPFASYSTYTSVEVAPVNITFMLKSKLNYDIMKEPYQYKCIVSLEDKGLETLQSSPITVTLTVEPYPDEVPEFNSQFFTGTVQDMTENSTVYVSPKILATSKDVPPSNEILYSMGHVDNVPDASYYFSIDNTTAVVTVRQDIDAAFRSWGSVNFIVYACDEHYYCGNALLTINMPAQEPNEVHFDISLYNVEFLVESDNKKFTVHAESSTGSDVEYNFIQNNALGLSYFKIDNTMGIISETTMATPGVYTLVVSANDGVATATATVNINIVDTLKDGSIVSESIVKLTVEENYLGPIYEVEKKGNFTYCIIGADPYYESDFEISSTGVVSVVQWLNAEYSQSALVKIRIYDGNSICTSSILSTSTLRNEILLNLTITDVNEYPPYYVYDYGQFRYPSIVQLQKCMPKLAFNKSFFRDNDVTPNHTFSLVFHDQPKLFEIDSKSGEIYYLDSVSHPYFFYTYFDVVVEEPPFRTTFHLTVDELNMDHIFTIKLKNVKLDEIEEKLNIIAKEAKIYIFLVYWSLVEGLNTGMSESWDVNAHAYALNELYGSPLDIEEVNGYLQASTYLYLVAQPFTDAAYYSEPVFQEESSSFKSTTIALSCVLGFLICLVISLLVYRSYRDKSKTKLGTVKTLGQAYANENFEGDGQSNGRSEMVLGDSYSRQAESSLETSSISESGGKDIYPLSPLNQSSPSQSSQRQVNNVTNDDSSGLACKSSEVDIEHSSPSTEQVGDFNKDESTKDSLSSKEKDSSNHENDENSNA